MNTTRLGTMLLAFALAPATLLSVQPANAAVAVDAGYCHSTYTSQNPDCIPLPPNSKDYKGVPIAVENKVKTTGLNCMKYVNVLPNDRIEKRRKMKRIEITNYVPARFGIGSAVVGNKIRLRFTDTPWGGYAIRYRVVDFKGRKSEPTHLRIHVGFGYQGGPDMC